MNKEGPPVVSACGDYGEMAPQDQSPPPSPAESHCGTAGGCHSDPQHPTQGGQSPQQPACAAPSTMDPEERKRLVLHMVRFLLENMCKRSECQANDGVHQCLFPYSKTMWDALTHISTCQAGDSCAVRHCVSFQQIISDFIHCVVSGCDTYHPREREGSPVVSACGDYGEMAPQDQSPPPSPAESHCGTAGGCHSDPQRPTQGGQSPQQPACAAPSTMDPEERKRLVLHMVRFLLENMCQRSECQANDGVRRCLFPYSKTMWDALTHISTCQAGDSCAVRHCVSYQQIISDFIHCVVSGCDTYHPREREGSPAVSACGDYGEMAQQDQSPPPSPAVSHCGTAGGCHSDPQRPTQGGQSPQQPACAAPSTMDPEERKRLVLNMVRFLLENMCQRSECQASDGVRRCLIPYSKTMWDALTHISTCQAGDSCTVRHCVSYQQIISDFIHCVVSGCDTYHPREREAESQDGIVPQVTTSCALDDVNTGAPISNAIPVAGGPDDIPLVPGANSTGTHQNHQEAPGDQIPSHMESPPSLQQPDTMLTEGGLPELGDSIPPNDVQSTLQQEPAPMDHTHFP